MVALGKLGERREPIERPRGGKAVEQHQRRRTFGPLELEDTDATPAFQVQEALFAPSDMSGLPPGLSLFLFCCHRLRAWENCALSASRPTGFQRL
jgi:hypothetical protein